jgi:hypothetical protein
VYTNGAGAVAQAASKLARETDVNRRFIQISRRKIKLHSTPAWSGRGTFPFGLGLLKPPRLEETLRQAQGERIKKLILYKAGSVVSQRSSEESELIGLEIRI